MNKIWFVFVFLFFGTSFSQNLQIYTLDQVEKLQQMEERPAMVFVSSSWCTYCKKMKQTIFKDKEVINLLNNKYYLVFIEADAKDPLFFKNKKYEFKPKGIHVGYNQILNILFENEQIAFPAILIFDSSWERLLILKSALNKKAFLEQFN